MKRDDPMETDMGAGTARPIATPTPTANSPVPFPEDREELIRRHRQLDEQLEELTRLGRLSPLQQHEAAILKKRKLALKDRIAALASSS